MRTRRRSVNFRFAIPLKQRRWAGLLIMEMKKTGPRAKEYLCTDIEEILELPAIDFGKGRIQEVLKACRILYEKENTLYLKFQDL